ncbi:MAG: hypothetical protein RL173_3593 [Fibrobacterota bacterium]|jgi:hypothetical protein
MLRENLPLYRMAIFRTALRGALLTFSSLWAANSDQLQWFAVSVPGNPAMHRSDAGMLGQDESPSVLLDLCARGGSYTGIDLLYQTNEASVGSYRWKQPAVDFQLETAVEALPGLVFGLDAVDHHPKTTATDGSAKSELFDPQGGLRVGGGFDLLRSWRQKSSWRWVVAGWLPVFSQTREWELRTGLIFARKLRLDASAVWSTPGIAARWTVPVDSVAPQDTLWWRSNQSRYALRIGGSPIPSLSLQAWGGTRRLRDPGQGAEPSWRNRGEAWFVGSQSSLATGPLSWELETRAEKGDQAVVFDGTSAFAARVDSGILRSSTDFSAGSARLQSKATLAKSVDVGVELSGAWMDLENASVSGDAPPPVPTISGRWSSTRRVSTVVAVSVHLPWATLEPRLGIQWSARDGQSIPIWQELMPFETGRAWSMPVGLGIARHGSMNGKIAYVVSGNINMSGTTGPDLGLRHHLEMKQGF